MAKTALKMAPTGTESAIQPNEIGRPAIVRLNAGRAASKPNHTRSRNVATTMIADTVVTERSSHFR